MKIPFSKSRRLIAGGALALMLLLPSHPAFGVNINRKDRLSPLAVGYLERGRIMLDNGNFAGVIDQLKHLEVQGVRLSERDREDCSYLLSMALYERGDEDCVHQLKDFAESYPASLFALQARLAAADYYFFTKRYPNALKEYDEVEFSRIQPSDRPTYEYRKGLAMVNTGQYEKAKTVFTRLSGDKEFSVAALYYLAYIDYMTGNLDSAYDQFSEVERKEGKKREEGLAPEYYLAQIDFTRGEYEKVISTGSRLLARRPVAELVPETERIVGLSYFKEGDYSSAKSMLRRYAARPDITTAADVEYALGVIDYRDGDFDGARKRFSTLTDLDNDLAQSAYLYLGQIAVKEGDSNAAAISFEKASRMNFDRNVTETSLFNYIAARTHGGNIPFSSSIPLINGFLKEFPRSRYASEVREYLAGAYFNEKDYAKALESINAIGNPSAKVLDMKQKVLYELGMEAMANNHPTAAARYLAEGVGIKGDAAVKAQSYLWLGDAYYALGKFADAEKAYLSYLSSDRKGENRTLATYNLGYALLLQDKYEKAASTFADALKGDPMLPQRLYEDALIRMADAQYYSGEYRLALKNYTAAIDNGAVDSDYATYRRAVMYGLAGDVNKKLSELNSLPARYPNSPWLPSALLEKGQTYNGLGDNTKAVEAFEQLRRTHRQTPEARKGILSLALSYMESGETGKAEAAYKDIISKWPTSEEAAMANEDLSRFYSVAGRVNEYAEFLRGVPGAPQMDSDEMEKLTFEGAETAFSQDFNNIRLLEKYVADYPNGKYLAQGLLDIAIGRDSKGDFSGSLDALNSLLKLRNDSPQIPEALLLKGEVLEKMGTARRKEALETFRELEKRGGAEYTGEAYAGIMRSTDKDSERIKYAGLVKNSAGISADRREEAEFYEAISMLKGTNASKGTDMLARLAATPKSLSGAKAAVALGEHYLSVGNVGGAEKVLTAFTDAGTPHEYWLARGFIALADVCHLRNKDYLAVEYLKSLRDNYPGDEADIQKMISTRLEKWRK